VAAGADAVLRGAGGLGLCARSLAACRLGHAVRCAVGGTGPPAALFNSHLVPRFRPELGFRCVQVLVQGVQQVCEFFRGQGGKDFLGPAGIVKISVQL